MGTRSTGTGRGRRRAGAPAWSVAIAGAMPAAAGVARADTTWTPLDLASFVNGGGPLINGDTFPEGPQAFACVPFELGDTAGGWAWYAWLADGPNPRVLEVPAEIPGARSVHLLINTYWGTPEPGLARVELVGTAGTVHEVPLIGGDDVRDYNDDAYTDTINGVTTVEVWTNGLGQRLDKLRIEVPESLDGGSLDMIRVVDEGADGVQRLFVAGITVASGDAPADLDGDGAVGFGDLLDVLQSWGPCDACPQDLDCDGAVAFGDVLVVLGSWSG